MHIKIIFLLSLALLQSCTSIKSSRVTSTFDMGLSYYMPMKDLLVSIKTKEKLSVSGGVVIESISIGVTDAYPDVSQNYMLKHGLNLFGKNTMDITLTETGLLSTANSKTVSSVSTALTNLTSSVASLSPAIMTKIAPLPQVAITCEIAREYSYMDQFSKGFTRSNMACGLHYSVSIIDSFDRKIFKKYDTCLKGCATNSNDNKCKIICKDKFKTISFKRKSGIYYKQNIPYKVEVKDSNNILVATSIVSSPSESIVKFMPITKTFFADNESTIGFDNGVITSFKMETKGELTAFFKLPADVIKAYFDAIGAILPIKKTNATTESELLKVNYLNELLKIKLERCSQAIKDDNKVLTAELGCFNLQ